MKILYLLSGSDFAGSTLSLLTLAEHAIQKGDEPFVVIPQKNERLINVLVSKNIPYFTAPIHFFCYPKKKRGIWYLFDLRDIILNEIKSFFAISKIIKQVNPDIIHSNVGPISIGHFLARKFHLPHIWHLREYGDLDFNLKPFPCKSFFHHCLTQDYPIAITRDIFRYHQLKSSKKATIIYNGVRYKQDAVFDEKKEKYFLCASRVSPEKGHDQVIQAFADFYKKNNDYKLVILGDGPEEYRNQLELLAIRLECSQAIEFKGFVPNVSDYMRKATALIVASPAEGFGRMTAEACFAGCLVIGKNAGGTKEILEETKGFQFDSSEELLSSMNKICKLPQDEYKSKALFAQEKAKELYSIEHYAYEVYSVYEKATFHQNGR